MLKIKWHNLKNNLSDLPDVQKTVWLDTIYGIFKGRRFNNDTNSFHVEGPDRMEPIKFESIFAWHEPYELSFIQPERLSEKTSKDDAIV